MSCWFFPPERLLLLLKVFRYYLMLGCADLYILLKEGVVGLEMLNDNQLLPYYSLRRSARASPKTNLRSIFFLPEFPLRVASSRVASFLGDSRYTSSVFNFPLMELTKVYRDPVDSPTAFSPSIL